ncbi:MAG: hypothetical protein QXP66_03975 [Candidatus Aenigmatarchaeota archaeon]
MNLGILRLQASGHKLQVPALIRPVTKDQSPFLTSRSQPDIVRPQADFYQVIWDFFADVCPISTLSFKAKISIYRKIYLDIYLFKYTIIFIFEKLNYLIMPKSNPSIKRERFKNVAGKRVQKVLDTIDSLIKCANKNNYEYNEEDVSKMMRALKDKLKILEIAYTSNTKSTKNTFKF